MTYSEADKYPILVLQEEKNTSKPKSLKHSPLFAVHTNHLFDFVSKLLSSEEAGESNNEVKRTKTGFAEEI